MSKSGALDKLLNRKKTAGTVAGVHARQSFMQEDDVDKFITHQLLSGLTFTQIVAKLEEGDWPKREAYYKVAQYVAREGIKEGKSLDEVFEAMVDHGWNQEIVVSVLNEVI